MAQPQIVETTINHEATLGIFAKDAWKSLSNFGAWGTWCPLFDNMRITNGKEGVGAIRKYVTTVGSLTTEERLTALDDNSTTLAFEMISMTPAIPGLVGLSTKITIKEVPEGTYIQRLTVNRTAGLGPDSIAMIKAKQTLSYTKENEILKAHVMAESLVLKGMGFFNDKVLNLTKAILTGQSKTWEYNEYPDWMGYLPRMVKGLPVTEVLRPNQIGDMLTRFIELVYQQAGAYIKAQLNPQQAQVPGNIYELEALGLITSGHVAQRGLKELAAYVCQHWESDIEFCQQLLQGVNPLHIQVVESISDVPDDLHNLQATDKQGTRSVKELISEKRLFMLDYRELADYDLCDFTPKTYFLAPVMLVYREIVENGSRLNVLGIQLHPSKNEIFTPGMKNHNRYKLARMFVACADTQIHEFRYHLGIGHLSMEPFCISTHNRLPKRDDFTHPIRQLLAPHLEGTIGINFLARQTLVAEKGAFTDKTFAVGTQQGLRLASDGWRKWHFYKSSFPEQLAARGFYEDKRDKLEGYYYREDGFKVWNAIGDYTTHTVDKIYATDADVHGDGDLQMWADETSAKDGAAVPGFPSAIKTKKELSHILQIIIWNGSAQHSVINYSQAPYQTLIPSRPNAMYRPMPDLPEDGSDVTEDYLKAALAPEFPMLFQLLFTWLLSLPSDSNLLNLHAFGNRFPDVDAAFHKKMNELTEEFNKRNEELVKSGKAAYIYLLPENVACSVVI